MRWTIGTSAPSPSWTALRTMIDRHFRRLPVVDDRTRVLGMLSMRHPLRQRVDVLTSQLDGLSNYVAADGIGG